MTNSDVGPPARPLDASGARRSILAQHQRLRELLERARNVADAALGGEAFAPDAVTAAIAELLAVMDAHLSFEESVLLPILRADPPAGPGQAAELETEHRQQRAMLSALYRQATAAPTVPTLATQLMFMTDWLMADMSHEEAGLLAPGVLRDPPPG